MIEHAVLHLFVTAALWSGMGIFVAAGLVVAFAFYWWSVEFIFRRMKWTATLIMAYRAYLLQKRGEFPG